MFHMLLAAIAASVATAEEATVDPQVRELLGKRVMIQGIPWDYTKGRSGRVLLPSGHVVYISEPYYPYNRKDGTLIRRLPNGKLVQIVGRLTLKTVPRIDPMTKNGVPMQTDGGGYSYLELNMESFGVIERVDEGFFRALE